MWKPNGWNDAASVLLGYPLPLIAGLTRSSLSTAPGHTASAFSVHLKL
jgi:hypothetical protein